MKNPLNSIMWSVISGFVLLGVMVLAILALRSAY